MTTDEQKAVTNPPGGGRLTLEQRISMLARKLERFRESHDKKDRDGRAWIEEMERELDELKSSLVS